MNGSRTVTDLARAVTCSERSAEQVLHDSLERIDRLNPTLNAFVGGDRDHALQQAQRVDESLSHGDFTGTLAGVPIAVKDNICTSFGRTTCASRILEHLMGPYDAHVVERLESAGGIIVGKTNLDAFGMGSSTEHSHFGPTRNPWSPDRVAGGSSGGSASAVAAGMVPAALGSDTGGSVRQPASFCGAVGLKPSYGRVSRYGLVAYASSLDQIGPITMTVEDAALLLQVIAGHDARDSTSVEAAVPDYRAALERPLKGIRVGVSPQYFTEGLDDGVRRAVEVAIDLLKEEGARVVPIELPHMKYAVACYYIIAPAEASSNLARFDGVRYGRRCDRPVGIDDLYARSRGEGFPPEVRRRILLGTYVLSSGYYDAYYLKASKIRTLIRRDFEDAFRRVDVIASPVTPTTAFRIGQKIEDPLAMYLNDIYTIPANLAGLCAISVPCGFDESGLPIGMQLMGPALGEETLLGVAHQYQQRTDHHQQRPALTTT